jgi:release factor glutamine methyltransferase
MTKDEEWLLKEKYHGERTTGFFADSARLEAGEPLAYVIGEIPFMNAKISLDSHPLIPRTETEYWVDKVIQTMQGSPLSKIEVLDLCAGSGCIGIAVLLNVPQATVDFAEIEERHHETIIKNLRENGVGDGRATVLGGDLFERVDHTYDFILSNPPYIDPALDRSEEGVRAHEPHTALFGGVHGIEFIERIIADAPLHLRAGGFLYIEHEPEQVGRLQELAHMHGFNTTTLPDQYGIERLTVLVRGA